ncbi:hypothetical protein BHE90_012452 [Fusarium euwallaceae]|uniref:Uncharacterized protein n=1 Tax=Fusarium euwallaceae TaxID=1147111 RepID=A0A430LBJ8_9HYPO|nr:hypothetical protein BHE90_012452 [Fusarium euwallaceae]
MNRIREIFQGSGQLLTDDRHAASIHLCPILVTAGLRHLSVHCIADTPAKELCGLGQQAASLIRRSLSQYWHRQTG